MFSSQRGARRKLRSRAFDAALALLLMVLSLLLLTSVVQRRAVDTPVLALATALLVVHSGCLAWRRRAPLAVLALNVTSGVAFYALGFQIVTLGVAILVALYTVAARTERVRSLAVVGAVTAVMWIALTRGVSASGTSTIIGNCIAFAVVWFLGDSARVRREWARPGR